MRFRPATTLLVIIALAGLWPGFRAWQSWRANSFRTRCLEARDRLDPAAEKAAASQWVTWDPASSEAWLFLAEAASDLGEPQRAADCLDHIPPDHPQAIAIYLQKAELEWTLLNQPLRGLETCRRIVDLHPRAAEAHGRIIAYYAFSLQRPKLLQAIRRAIEAGAAPREAYTYLLLADHLVMTNGVEFIGRWLASDPDAEEFIIPLAVYAAMNCERDAGRTASSAAAEQDAQALNDLDDLLRNSPHNPVLLSYLLSRHVEEGNLHAVAQLLQQVDTTGADDHMVWVFRGWWHAQQGDLADAEAALQQALKLHPLSPRARNEYAGVLRRLKKLPEAEQMGRLAAEGHELRKELLLLPEAAAVSDPLLERIALDASSCDDQQVAQALREHVLAHRGHATAP